MRVVVLGATGPIGYSVVEALRFDPDKRVDAVVAVAPVLPGELQPHVDWRAIDMASDLSPVLEGADAVVHAASSSLTDHVLSSVADAGVRRLVVASTFAAYSPADPGQDPVDESWPLEGVADVDVARRAVAAERAVEAFAAEHKVIQVVRIRAGLVLGPLALDQFIRRFGLFGALLRGADRLPLVPGIAGASLPVVHHDDLAAAFRAAVTGNVSGAYNVALDEPLDLDRLAAALGGHRVEVPAGLAALGVGVMDRLLSVARAFDRRAMEPAGLAGPAAWLEMATRAPRLDTARARRDLAWLPAHPLDGVLRSTLGGHSRP